MRYEWNKFPIYSLNGINGEQWLRKHVIVWLLSWECGTFLRFPSSATGFSLSHLPKTKPEFLNLNYLEEISQIIPGNKYSSIYISESGTVNWFQNMMMAPWTARSRRLSYLSWILQTTLGFYFPSLAQLPFWSLPVLLFLSVLNWWWNAAIKAYRTNHPATLRPHMTWWLRGSKVVLIWSANLRRFKIKCCRIRPGLRGRWRDGLWPQDGYLLVKRSITQIKTEAERETDPRSTVIFSLLAGS